MDPCEVNLPGFGPINDTFPTRFPGDVSCNKGQNYKYNGGLKWSWSVTISEVSLDRNLVGLFADVNRAFLPDRPFYSFRAVMIGRSENFRSAKSYDVFWNSIIVKGPVGFLILHPMFLMADPIFILFIVALTTFVLVYVNYMASENLTTLSIIWVWLQISSYHGLYYVPYPE